MATEENFYRQVNVERLEIFRETLALAMAGQATLAPIKYMAYGDGGHTPDNDPKEIDPTRTTLFNQLGYVEATLVQPNAKKIEVRAVVLGTQAPILSEIMLLDALMNPIGHATFAPKYTTGSESYLFKLTMRF